QNRRLDAECFPIGTSAMHNLFLVNQPKNPVKMFFVDDFTVIWIPKRLFSVLLLNLLLHFFDQPVLNSTVAVNIVRCNTGLSAVQIFSEYDPSCCQFDIGSLIYNTRALSAQL